MAAAGRGGAARGTGWHAGLLRVHLPNKVTPHGTKLTCAWLAAISHGGRPAYNFGHPALPLPLIQLPSVWQQRAAALYQPCVLRLLFCRRQAFGKVASQGSYGGVIKCDGGGQLDAKLGADGVFKLYRACGRGGGQKAEGGF